MARNTLYPPSVKPGIPRLSVKPKGWAEVTFGDVLQVIQRPAEIEDNVEYQLVTAKRNRGGIVPRETLTGENILTKIQYFVAKDDFLISKRQIVHGACGIVPSTLDGALVSGEYSVLRVKDGLLLKYLDYFSHTDYFQMACFQSSVGVAVEKMIFDLKNWLKIKLYLPPATEQRKIIDILTTWDEAINKTERLLSDLRERKKGLMQRLLTGKVRFRGFEKSKGMQDISFTKIPVDWEFTTFGETFKLTSGSTPTRTRPENFEGDNLWVTSAELNYGIIDNSAEKVTDEAIKSANLKIFPVGTFLIAITGLEAAGTRGRCGILGKPAVFSQSCTAFSQNPRVETKYLFYYYLLYGNEIAFNFAQGTKQQSLPGKILSLVPFFFPKSLEEQRRIVDVLDASEKEIALQAEKLVDLKQQKKGLMQKLLSGQIRVKV
jgi:type I restriction enzyme S subunit